MSCNLAHLCLQSKKSSKKHSRKQRRHRHSSAADDAHEDKDHSSHSKPRKDKKSGKRKHRHKSSKKRGSAASESKRLAKILAALEQPDSVRELLSLNVDAMASTSADNEGPSSSDTDEASSSESGGIVGAAAAAMQAISTRASAGSSAVSRQSHASASPWTGRVDEEAAMRFKRRLRPGNEYSFISRLQPHFDFHFRVTVLKPAGEPEVVHVSVNSTGNSVSILPWWCVLACACVFVRVRASMHVFV